MVKYRVILNFILSLSLVLVPSYGYPQANDSQDSPPSLDQLVEYLKDQNKSLDIPPEVEGVARIFLEMGEAVEKGTFREYLESHPQLRNQFDILNLQNQEVRIIHPKTREVEFSRKFDNYIPESHHLIKIRFNEVGFDKNGHLTLFGRTVVGDMKLEEGDLGFEDSEVQEGEIKKARSKEVGITHHFHNIKQEDVVDWVYDRDLLVLLHKTKGLMAFHMMFAKEFIGEVPIPSIVIPGTKHFSNLPGLKLNSVNRYIEPPKIHEDVDGMSRNSEGKAFFTAGDIIISSQLENGDSVLERVFPRTKLYNMLYIKYMFLNLLLKLVTPYISQASDVQRLTDTIDQMITRHSNHQGGVEELLASILNREPLLFLNRIPAKQITSLLRGIDELEKRDKDIFLYSQWLSDYQNTVSNIEKQKNNVTESATIEEKPKALKQTWFAKIRRKIRRFFYLTPEERAQKKQYDLAIAYKTQQESLNRERQKRTGSILTAQEIIGLKKDDATSQEQPQAEKKFKISELKTVQKFNEVKIVQKVREVTKNFWKEHKIDLAVASVGAVWALGYIHMHSYEHELPSSLLATYNMLTLGVGVLTSVYFLARFSIPVLKGIEKATPPSRFKTSINQTIEKWENQKTEARIVGAGFKVAASLMVRAWGRLTQLLGQPHFLVATDNNVNPFEKITPESHLGQALGLNKSKRLGLSAQWRTRTEAYQQHRQMLNVKIESNENIDFLSRQLALYAMLGEEFDSSLLLTGKLALLMDSEKKQKLQALFQDEVQSRKYIWVAYQLSKYIKNRDDMDTSQQIFHWDPEVVQSYYDKAVELSHQDIPLRQLKRHQDVQWVLSGLRKMSMWNQEASEMLRHFTPQKAVSDIFWIHLIMDHITLITLSLTPGTDRVGASLTNVFSGLSREPLFGFASFSHFHEIIQNIAIHSVISARTELQYLDSSEEIKKLLGEILNLYEPLTPYDDETKLEHEQSTKDYVKGFFKYMFTSDSWGEKIKEGTPLEERLDAGHQIWNYVKIIYRFAQVSFILGVTSRWWFTNQSGWDAVLGSLFFQVAGPLIYAWPQLFSLTYNGAVNQKANFHKELLGQMTHISYKLENNLYESSEGWKADYKKIISILRNLFKSNEKFFKEFKEALVTLSTDLKLDPVVITFLATANITEQDQKNLDDYIESLSFKDIQNDGKIINEQLKSTTNLPFTEVSKAGQQLVSLFTIGIFSNFAFVYLSVLSFSDDITLKQILMTIVAVVGSTWIYNWISEKDKSENIAWFKNLKERDIAQMLDQMPEGERDRLVQVLKDINILTNRDLMKNSEKDLLNTGLDQASVDEVTRALSQKHLHLPDDSKVESVSHGGNIEELLRKCKRIFTR